MDMYLSLEGVPGEREPIVLHVLAWSWGASNSSSPRFEDDEGEKEKDDPKDWDAEKVGKWLQENGFETLVSPFAEAGVSGKHLLDSWNLEELPVANSTVGELLRFGDAIKKLQKQKRGKDEYQGRANIQDLSLTTYMDDRCTKL